MKTCYGWARWIALSLLLMLLAACGAESPGVTGKTPVEPPATETPLPATETPLPTETTAPTASPTAAPTAAPTATATVSTSVQATIPPSLLVPTTNVGMLAMQDENNGWALGEGLVLRTMDGGANWINVTPEQMAGTTFRPSAFFLDAQTGWVVQPGESMDSGVMYRTTDAGTTWQPSNTPFAGGSIDFIDALNGWVLDASDCGAGSCGGAIYQTTDGGETWASIATIDPQNPNQNSLPFAGNKTGISFRDRTHGWVGGTQPQDAYVWLFASQDGGQNWVHQDLALPEGFTQSMTVIDPPRFFSELEGILPVTLFNGDITARVFYVTVNGGATWTANEPVQVNGLYDCITIRDCWVWDGASMNITHDSGLSWGMAPTNVNLSLTLGQMDFASLTTGWVTSVDANGLTTLYQTTDGGLTWNP